MNATSFQEFYLQIILIQISIQNTVINYTLEVYAASV